jgi:hypothetical protein
MKKNILIILTFYSFIFLSIVPREKYEGANDYWQNTFSFEYSHANNITPEGKQIKSNKDPLKDIVLRQIKKNIAQFNGFSDSEASENDNTFSLSQSAQDRQKLETEHFATTEKKNKNYYIFSHQKNSNIFEYFLHIKSSLYALKERLLRDNLSFLESKRMQDFYTFYLYLFLLHEAQEGQKIRPYFSESNGSTQEYDRIFQDFLLPENFDLVSLLREKRKRALSERDRNNYDKKIIKLLGKTFIFHTNPSILPQQKMSVERDRVKNRINNVANKSGLGLLWIQEYPNTIPYDEQNVEYGEPEPGRSTYLNFLFDKGKATNSKQNSSNVRDGKFFISMDDQWLLNRRNLPQKKPSSVHWSLVTVDKKDNRQYSYCITKKTIKNKNDFESIANVLSSLNSSKVYSITFFSLEEVIWLLSQ